MYFFNDPRQQHIGPIGHPQSWTPWRRQGQSFQVDDPQSKTVGALKQQLFADALEVPLRSTMPQL